MKIYTLFCFLAGIVIGISQQGTGTNKDTRRRRLDQSSEIQGPCVYFTEKNQCDDAPGLNPSGGEYATSDNGLSKFAHDWMQHTCCEVLNEPLAGVISSVWLWLQVCTKAMNTMNSDPQKYETQDHAYAAKYRESNGPLPYNIGPLHSMKEYCPQDLEGGKLSEWVVASFFPVMRVKNPNFKQSDTIFTDCDDAANDDGGAVTVLLTNPKDKRRLGHIALVLHEDDAKLDLPVNYDNKHYVSFSNYGNTIGSMITGTQASYVGFGKDLKGVTTIATLYNANIPKMLEKWEEIKKDGVMFDLLENNCAYTVMKVLSAGYPKCQMKLNQLWTPDRAYDRILELKTKVETDTVTTSASVSLEKIHKRQITPKSGVDAGVVVAIALACFFGTLVLAILVAVIIIMKIKADAAQQLDRNLANLLISAASTKEATPDNGKVKKNSVVPDMGNCIQSTLEQHDTFNDGQTDKNEFMKWAKEHNLKSKQAELMWSELDRDNNNQVDRAEWDKYIEKRPNLKWLATRLQSVARK